MSTWLYLECLDHDPPLTADEEPGQHLYDLVVNSRDDIWPSDYFRVHAARFLAQHLKCRIGILDESNRRGGGAMTENGPQRHETARVGADTHPHPLGALRATCAFLAGVLLNVVATGCMVAYSEACRRREDERESIRRRLVG